ncbi:hypothetical protein AAE478_009768 [Parahypoxylon ruwenzoriense]
MDRKKRNEGNNSLATPKLNVSKGMLSRRVTMLRQQNHKPYESLQPVISLPCPFHTVTIDLAFRFPQAHDESNALTVAVCKPVKATNLIPGRHDWSAPRWADALYDRFLMAG